MSLPGEASAVGPAAARHPRRRLAVLGVALALLALTLLARSVRAAPMALTAAAAELPYLWLATLGLGLALGWRWRDRVVLAICGVMAALWLTSWGRAWSGHSGQPASLAVLSWNVQRLGFEDADDGPALACVVETIQALQPDALTLAEVSARDIDRLSARLDMRCVQVDYAGTGGPKRGGVAACARGARWSLVDGGPRRFVDSVDWHYAFAELSDGARTVNLLAVHLQPYALSLERALPTDTARVQGAEATALVGLVGRLRDATVIGGDFNSPRDAALHVGLRRHLVDAWERVGWGPGRTVRSLLPLRVDYVYVSAGIAPVSAEIPESACSDHRPLWVGLRP